MKENFSMLINFNLEKLDKLLYDFYRLTGLTISIWDSDFNQLAFQPKNMQSFCRVIKETKIGKQRCLLSDKKLCMECKESGKPVTHRCHAGLIDTAVPIKFKDTVLGYIIFGQVTDSASSEESADIARLATDLKIDSDTLKNLYSELDSYDSDRIESAANILKMSARYLWLSEYIDVGYDSVASEIDKFIKENVSSDISLKTLCSKFNISKNKIYDLSKRWFKMPIGEYIASIRIDEAKKLLTSTDLPISDISAMVGISDYNYFTKFFRERVGITPLKYRKEFPFNLHKSDA